MLRGEDFFHHHLNGATTFFTPTLTGRRLIHFRPRSKQGEDLFTQKNNGTKTFLTKKQRGADFFRLKKQRGEEFFWQEKQRGGDFFWKPEKAENLAPFQINFDRSLTY